MGPFRQRETLPRLGEKKDGLSGESHTGHIAGLQGSTLRSVTLATAKRNAEVGRDPTTLGLLCHT